MKIELFPFQRDAVAELRGKLNEAHTAYCATHAPQVVALQAPTGSGKTVMASALIEDVFFGDVQYTEEPNAIFVWLSDSPQLNEQSKAKINAMCDRIPPGRTVTIREESFDRETLEDGTIYFLNTQKLSKSGRLTRHSETQRWTIWETLANTAREKGERLYFIIDEAHRGMQGGDAGKATTIMQAFLKGCPQVGLPTAMPIVVGLSATPQRFLRLVGEITSTVHKVVIAADDVRASGLLKDRIIVTYPEDPTKEDDFAVLGAATEEWQSKCEHWREYCKTQHYRSVEPVFVVQVKAGTDGRSSDTDLDAVVAKIEEIRGEAFAAGEVVHAFGEKTALTAHGLKVQYVEPSAIAEDRAIKVVIFKESLSTGWDCPRAETMMSFRKAEDATYIAQLLGRMVRTPLQCHVNVDDSLNDVKLFLPYFNTDNVNKVVEELKSSECGEIPSDVESTWLHTNVTWSVRPRLRPDDQRQMKLDFGLNEKSSDDVEMREVHPQTESTPSDTRVLPPTLPEIEADEHDTRGEQAISGNAETTVTAVKAEQQELPIFFDREGVLKAINEIGLLTFTVRTASQRVADYLDSLVKLAGLLTREGVRPEAQREVKRAITDIIHDAIEEMKGVGSYTAAARQVTELKLATRVYDGLGESIQSYSQTLMAFASESELERQLRYAEVKLGGCGIANEYGRRFIDENDEDAFKVECIVFTRDVACITRVHEYAKAKYREWIDQYRVALTNRNESTRHEYDAIATNGDPVSRHTLMLPETIHGIAEASGREYANHLFADDEGRARIKLNADEAAVIEEEAKRADFVCWLRNVPRAPWALCVPYRMGGETKAFYPDFLVVRRDSATATGYVIDVLEPHGEQFADNLPKAKGLAEYAKLETRLGRIELIRVQTGIGGKRDFRRLDLNAVATRERVTNCENDSSFCAFFSE